MGSACSVELNGPNHYLCKTMHGDCADTVRVRDPEELYGSSMPVTETVEEIEKERFGKDSPSRD